MAGKKAAGGGFIVRYPSLAEHAQTAAGQRVARRFGAQEQDRGAGVGCKVVCMLGKFGNKK